MMRKVVFFDRDGVLNVDKGYLYKVEDLEWMPGALEALAYVTAQGYTTFVVTNQSGIARGYYTVKDMRQLHRYMTEAVNAAGGKIERFYYCPHLSTGAVAEYAIECDCRKPKPGMLLQACREYGLAKEDCIMVGDGARDIEAATAAGIKGYLYQGGNLLQFVKEIID